MRTDYIDITRDRGKMGTEKYRMYTGTPTKDIPYTWKHVEVFRGLEITNNYNTGLIDVYVTQEGKLRYSTYRDGCFWPYTGTLQKLT